MQPNSLEYKIPSFATREAYDFDTTEDTLEIYRELNNISEEIQKCRARNI